LRSKVLRNNLSKILRSSSKNIFISTWKTDNTSVGSSNDDQIKLPLEASGTYDFYVDWGDGSVNYITTWDQVETTHTYIAIGTYTIKIRGLCIGFKFNNTEDRLKLLKISNCGNLELGNSDSHFYGCSNLATIGTKFKGKPTNLALTFRGCEKLNSEIDIDCSEVITMDSMFYGCFIFNKPLNLDTVKSTSMRAIFYQCNVFNSVLSLNTSNVINMANMFDGCFAFNQSVSFMNTAKATTMSTLFGYCYDFNQNVSNFNTSLVTNMANMFDHCTAFNQDISMWNFEAVTTMANMFTSATSWSTENYDKFLISAAAQAVQNGVQFDCATKYTSGGAAEAARTFLVGTKGWTINDAGAA
jgi:surface protein